MAEDDDGSIRRPPAKLREPCEVQGSSLVAVHHGFGFASRKRNNIHLLRGGSVLTTLGSAAMIIDPSTKKTEYVFCPDDEGVGCVCVHPNEKFFAVCGQGDKPNVYIYAFPSKRLHRVLKLGTEKSYSCAAFSAEGSKLATVGAAPDYLLTVWDWMEERIILRNKAFSQEIYNVSFSPMSDGFLTTSGLGHIRFWKMAKTFTGLKLQGDIGKFGKVELSDVAAYAALPDGKVLSGSEGGSLLLWDGNFIKLEIRLPGGNLPHQGEVHVCKLLGMKHLPTAQFVTAAEDGWIRWWSLEAIDSAEIDDENPYFELKPNREVHLEGVVPISICSGNGYLVIQDREGSIFKVDDPVLPRAERDVVVGGHSGAVTALATSPSDHFAATAGEDCTVRLWDYVTKHIIYQEKFSAPATCICWADQTIDLSSRTVLVGFKDGVVRVLLRAELGWKLIEIFKPHNCAVTSITFSPDGSQVATTGTDGTVFFLTVMPKAGGFFEYKPIGFVRGPEGSSANTLCWFKSGDKVLCALDKGQVLEVTLPHRTNNVEMPCTKETFELSSLPQRTFTFKRQPVHFKPSIENAESDEEVEKDENGLTPAEAAAQAESDRLNSLTPGNIHCIKLNGDNETSFYIGLDGVDAGPIYECSFSSEYPITTMPNLPTDDGLNVKEENAEDEYLPGTGKYPACTIINTSWSQRFLLTGTSDGVVKVRPTVNPECFVRCATHDGRGGRVNAAVMSFDDQFLLTCSNDGSLFVHRCKPDLVETVCQDLFQKPGNRIKAKNARSSVEIGSPGNTSLLRSLPVVLGPNGESKLGFAPVEPPLEKDAHDEVFEAGIKLANDITDHSAYSIQDDKLKTEEDHKIRLANIEKDKVRKVIEQLRGDFERVLQENENDNEQTRLKRECFNIDNELTLQLVEEGKQQLEEVIKETQWNVNMSKVQLDKLKTHFLDNVLVDCISLKAFNQKHVVQSFRTAKFSETLKQSLSAVHEFLNNNGQHNSGNNVDELYSQSKTNGGRAVRNSTVGSTPSADGPDSTGNATSKKKKKNTGGGWEARKQGRKQRKADMQELLERKPDENADDPEDVAAIEYVLNNMGDYKLKSAEDYQVPLHLQVNAEKKSREALLLSEAIQNVRMSFNKKFLALRELKKRIVESAREDHHRVQEINKLLVGPDETEEDLGLPLVLDADEWPENRLVFNETELDEFVENNRIISTPRVPETGNKGCSHNSGASAIDATALELYQAAIQSELGSMSNSLQVEEAEQKTANAYTREQWSIRRKLLLYEKNSILSRNISSIKAFDSAIYKLRLERAKLEADLLSSSLKQILLSKEQRLLNEFEKKDELLTNKLKTCKEQKNQVVADITSCQERLAAKKGEIEVWQEKDRLIMDEFYQLINSGGNQQQDKTASGDVNPYSAQLLKIFKRKIKRSKNKDNDDSDDSDMSDSDESDYGDSEEEDYDELNGGEPEEERCPDGCDPVVYEKVLELREKRLDQEEVLNEFNKAIEELKKANDRHQGREKQIDKELRATIVEIQAFQNEKQRKLNEIDVSVVVKLSQISCLCGPNGEEAVPSSLLTFEEAEEGENERLFQAESEAEFQQDKEVDSEDVEIGRLKEERINVLRQMETLEDELDEDEVIEQQEQLITKLQTITFNIWKRRRRCEQIREAKSKLVLPSSIENALIFDKGELDTLHSGIGKLISENKAKRAEFKNLHLTQKRLTRERKQKEEDIVALQSKCNDLQMLKFGQIIDLDAIEKVGMNKQVADLSVKFMEQERLNQREMTKIQKKIILEQEELLGVTKRNSALLQQIAQLTEKQNQLEVELKGSSNSNSTAISGLQSHREARETAKLTQLVKVQSNEIQSLKMEINTLRGGNTRINQNQVLE